MVAKRNEDGGAGDLVLQSQAASLQPPHPLELPRTGLQLQLNRTRRRGKERGGEREGGICLPRLGQQVEGLTEVWEASEWPSGKGSVSLGWAEAEDTGLPPLPECREGQTELWRLSPAEWGTQEGFLTSLVPYLGGGGH